MPLGTEGCAQYLPSRHFQDSENEGEEFEEVHGQVGFWGYDGGGLK